ncbi:copper amine oxidase N-terminal domain-containing protein [bacterium]|nr:MAG: copper amine oxidase N-terminal domain-containing protein [bacterium]
MKTQVTSRLIAGALLASVTVPSFANEALTAFPPARTVSVQLNGQPLALSATPLQLNGRTLLPLRDVFESLGAQVNWNPTAQSIAAQSGTTQIQLGINNPVAFVNGRNVNLDQPAILVGGRAFVPLRFVAEATGAQVDYNSQLQLVSIQKANPFSTGGTQVADYRNDTYNPPADEPAYIPPTQNGYVAPTNDFRGNGGGNFRAISIPADSVVPVQIDTALSSKDSRVGQRFTATVVSKQLGDSEFPAGTKLEGIVTEARQAEGKNPGVLDLTFQTAILPDGNRVPLRGDLTSLDQQDVSQNGGRLVAKGARKNDTLKIVGIGAGAGFVLGRVLSTNSTVSTILGAAGGYLFSRSRNQKVQEARLSQNTTLGVRLRDSLRFRDTSDYSNLRQTYLANNNGAFDPNYYGYDSRVSGSARDNYDGYEVSDRLPAPAPVGDDLNDFNDNPNNGNWNNGGPNNGNWNNANPDDNWNNAGPNNGTWNGNTNNDNWNNGGPNNGNWNDNRPNNGDNWNNGGGIGQRISVPEGAVVPIRIDQQISSATAHVGDQVSATIDSQRIGDSEFPAGTRILGTVVEARAKQGNDPGVLDFDFRTAQLPSGQRVPLRAELISLDDKGVQTQGGRLVAAKGSSSSDRAKIIGVGAVAGFAIGRLFKKDGILPSVLGALGGYIYSDKNNKNQAREAVLPQNSRFGLRLSNGVSYNDNTYYAARAQYLRRN